MNNLNKGSLGAIAGVAEEEVSASSVMEHPLTTAVQKTEQKIR